MVVKSHEIQTEQDEGYAWMVCLASFIGYFLVTMGLCTSGILFQEYMREFGCTHAEAAFIPSLQCSVGALLGVFIAPQVKKYGSRMTTAFGTFIGTSGYIMCCFSDRILHLYISLGVLVGIGNGFIFFSSAVAVQFHFNKRRALASALSTCGVSLAPFAFAPTVQWLITTYTWRGATLQMGAMYLNGFVAAGLMRPVRGNVTNAAEMTQEKINVDKIDQTVTETSSSESLDMQCSLSPINNTDIKYVAIKTSDKDLSRTKKIKHNFNVRTTFRNLFVYLTDIFDLTLLSKWRFLLFTAASCLNLFGHLATYLYIPVKSVTELGICPSTSAWFISAIGISTTMGRLCSGLVGDSKFITKYRCVHFGLPMFLTGLSTILAAFLTTSWQLYIYAIVFGIFTGVYFVAQQPLLVKILGVDNFPKSFGLMLIFTGSASIIAQPFAGWLVDRTGLMMTPLVVCGSLQAVGGVLAMLTWQAPQNIGPVQQAV